MKWIIFLIAVFSFVGCDDTNEYLKHDMKYEKTGSCDNQQGSVDIVANTIGERYTFQECLAESYAGGYSVERKGDTVNVQFEKGTGKTALYKITLDINTRPEYHYLTINKNTFPVTVRRY